MKHRLFSAVGAFMLISVVGACRNAGGDASAGENSDWVFHGRTRDEQRYSPLDQINDKTVKSLGLAWSYDLDTSRGQEATPLVIEGVLYTSTAWSKVVALDAATGKLIWSYDPEVPGKTGFKACCDVVSRGLAYNGGKLFLATLDGRLQALDAKSGRLIWSVMTVNPAKPYTITGAPRVARGKVFIGNGGAEYGVRGYVSAYDEDSGKLVWRFYTVPGDPARKDNAASDEILERLARKTWFGNDYYKYGGGGTVWDAIVYDEELNQLYIGVGNGSPDNHDIRSEGKGDNLFLASIVALDPDTGKYRWHYQQVPGETWDYTATQPIILATLDIEGKSRRVLMQAPKNGFFYVLDRENGHLISAEKFAPANWAERIDLKTGRPVENPAARYKKQPFLATIGGGGAHSWHPMAFSPQTGLVYIPAQSLPMRYQRTEPFSYRPGRWNLGFEMTRLPLPEDAKGQAAIVDANKGALIAWDPLSRKEVWRVAHSGPVNGGVLATRGKLVFQGAFTGTFNAYRASDGIRLWSFPTANGVVAAPVSYSVKGIQHIAVVTGLGGGIPLTAPTFAGARERTYGRILAFRLGGAAKLPEESSAPASINTVSVDGSPSDVEKGRILFADNCAACHGVGAWAAGVVPDLRRSGALADKHVWRQIVLDGALEQNGMVGFKGHLNEGDAENIRRYVASQAARLKAN